MELEAFRKPRSSSLRKWMSDGNQRGRDCTRWSWRKREGGKADRNLDQSNAEMTERNYYRRNWSSWTKSNTQMDERTGIWLSTASRTVASSLRRISNLVAYCNKFFFTVQAFGLLQEACISGFILTEESWDGDKNSLFHASTDRTSTVL